MTTLSICMIGLDEAEFIGASIKSVIDWSDEIIFIDGGSTDKTIEILDSFKNTKIKVIHSKWNGDFGEQRNIASKYASSEWILQLDCDEILSDNGFLLKEFIEKNPQIDVFDIEYIHYIRDLAHIDASVPVHVGMNRLFKKQGISYSRHLHELAHSTEWQQTNGIANKGFIQQVKLHHLGYLKSLSTISKKYKMNIEKKSPIHTKEYLQNWRNTHLFGKYPVREINPIEWEYPQPLIELFALRE